MVSLNMNGPYPFTSKYIDDKVKKTSPGNYALGHVNDQDTFVISYVGRSDSDVKQELINRLSDRYPRFKFSYAGTPKEAFNKECKNYHDFGESASLDNKIHPASPGDSNLRCPCGN